MKQRSLNFIQILACLSICLFSCQHKKTNEVTKVNHAFQEYVSAFTSGIISSNGTFTIQLTEEFKQDVTPNTPINKKTFAFEPAIKGEAYWIDNRTIEFRPEMALPSGQEYTGHFKLGSIATVGNEFSKFPIKFKVITQNFQVQTGSLLQHSEQNAAYIYKGSVVTADFMKADDVEKLITSQQSNNALNIIWEHESTNKTHIFYIEDIERKETDSQIFLSWNGKVLGIENKGSRPIGIPGMSNFTLIKAQLIHIPTQYVLLTFSDFLEPNQNLQGLIRIEDEKNLKYTIDKNTVKVYLEKRTTGTKLLTVEKSVKNSSGTKLKSNNEQNLTFEATKPDVRLIGKGIIIPQTDKVTFPFEAVNLSAVDIRVIQVFEENVPQFLQINNLKGERELRRVGRLISKTRIDLVADNLLDYGVWNAFSVDLKDLIKQEPGAIYRIEISFKKSYSLYPCYDETTEEEEDVEDWDEEFENEQSYWDIGDYYYGNYGNYNWRDRDNPCQPTYYRNKKYSRNVLASNIGLIAKSSNDKEIKIFATDIISTKPLQHTEIELLTYQLKTIASGKTDENGMLTLPYKQVPFLLVAKKDNQNGYLKLGKGLSLSMSKFDVSGAKYKRGIKGFIYGERGVWRPGDTIFINFVLEDKEHILPPNHPITFELIDPLGKTAKRIVKTSSVDNFYDFTCTTQDESPTGNWLAKVKVGGSTFTKQIKVETIKPNRLKIKLDFGKDIIKRTDRDLKGSLEVKWLHGAIAKNLKAEIDMELSYTKTKFSTFTDYTFNDPSINFQSFEKRIFSGNVNELGKAAVSPTIDLIDNAPGMLTAKFKTKVFEKGGNFSVNQINIPYALYDTYVGIKPPKGDKMRGMLLTDQKHTVEVVTLNANGKKLSINNLVAKLYKVQWRWWWQSGSDNIGSYISRRDVKPIMSKKFNTKGGLGSFEIEVKYPDWGRYIVKVEAPGGHSAGKTVYIDWPGWAGRAQDDSGGGATMLNFSTDKTDYKVGETAKLTIPSSEGGRALVSLEKGSKVIDAFWVETQKDNTCLDIAITKEMAPNVYINISMLQPHSQTINDLPIRRYGVIPIKVDDQATRLSPVISMANELAPEKEAKVIVSEKDGKDMTFTVSVVDEGLLDLTNFKTPNAWSTFYAREALSVRSWDMYDLVMGAYGAQIEACFAIGGDGDLDKNKDKKAKRFKPVVKHFGPFHIEKGETIEVKFKIPRYIGSVKTMVVAGHNGAYGNAEENTPVKSPLMLFGTLPRVLSPQEKVNLPVTLFALDDMTQDITVELKTNGLIDVVGEATKTIHFDRAGEKDFYFEVNSTDQLGIAKVTLLAKSGKNKASYEIEMDIRTPNPIRITNISALIKEGKTWQQAFELFGINGTNNVTIETSSMPPLNLEKRLKYLIKYPYGCIEQTTSSVFPQIYLKDLMKIDKKLQKEINNNVDEGLNRLRLFQLSNGGFSYWPGNTEVNEWGTNYAGHFLIEAKEKGHSLPIGMFDEWLDYQTTEANNWTLKSDRWGRNTYSQAYRLFTLALANKANLGAMNRLREQDNLSSQSRQFLAMAYLYSGNKNAALDILHLPIANTSTSYWGPYGSSHRNKALILETLLAMKSYDEAMPLIKEMSTSLQSNHWMSTQSTAFCLRAMAKAANIFKQSLDQFEYTIQLDDDKSKEIMATQLINQHPIEVDESQNSHNIAITNKSKSPFYINLVTEGVPLVDLGTDENKNLNLSVKYTTLDGKRLNPEMIEQGTDFKAEFTVANPGLTGNYRDLALTAMFPSGWEIINTRLNGSGTSYTKDIADYQDIRDDRVNLFFDLNENQSKTFVVLLNASYLGEYNRPSIQCAAMYDNNTRARISGGKSKIVNPGKLSFTMP